MSGDDLDQNLEEFLEIRKPGAHLEEGVIADDFVLMLGVDLVNFPKFPRVDDNVAYPRADLDIRYQLDVDSGAELPDYSGAYRPDLRFTDFSKEALATKFVPWSERYLQLVVDGWAAEVAERYGAETMAEIEWTAWNDQVVPEIERMKNEFLPAGTVFDDPNQHVREEDRPGTRVEYAGLFTPGPNMADLSKEQLVTWLLGSHEYLLQCIEAWAAQITVRYGLDVMFDIQYTLWGNTVLPGVKKLKAEYLGITGNTVADWMKDLQIGRHFDARQGLRPLLRDARARRRDHDLQPLRRRRPMGGDGPAGHLGEELPLHLSEVDDRHDEDVQPEHGGRHPRHPAPSGSRERVLQMAVQHADRGRPRIRPGGADDQAREPPALTVRLVSPMVARRRRFLRPHAASRRSRTRAISAGRSRAGASAPRRRRCSARCRARSRTRRFVIRRARCVKSVRSSSRASEAPRQKCVPNPNATCGFG